MKKMRFRSFSVALAICAFGLAAWSRSFAPYSTTPDYKAMLHELSRRAPPAQRD